MDTPSRSASPLPPDMPVTPTDEQCNRLPSIKQLLEAGEILDREQAAREARSRSLSGSISPPHDLSSYAHAHVHHTNHAPALQEQMRQLRISDSNSSLLMRHPEAPMNRHPHPPRRAVAPPPHPLPPSHMLSMHPPRSQEFHSMGPPTTPRFQPQFAHHYSQPVPPSPSPQQDMSIYYNQFPQVGYTFGAPQQAWEYVGAKPLAEETRSLRACAECRRRKVCCNTMPGMSSCERCIKQNIKCTPQPKYERPRKSTGGEGESGAASKSGPVRSGRRSHEHPHPYARADDGDFTAPRRASLGDDETFPRTRSKSKFFKTQPIVPIVLELQRSNSLPDIRFPHLPSHSQPNFERRASFA